MQLAFMADAAKRGGAGKALAVVPYLAYARQDKMFLSGEGISVETVARMLKAAGIDELLTVNIHSEPALTKFPFPAKTLSAIPLIAEYFVQKGHKGAFALSPDKGAMFQIELPVLSAAARSADETRSGRTQKGSHVVRT